MKKHSAFKAYATQNEIHIEFSEREKAILEKAKIFGSSTFQNPQFAKTLFKINPQEASSSNDFEDMKEIVSWVVSSIESAQMSKEK